MKKIALAMLLSVAFTSHALADNFYTSPQVGVWSVFGSTGSDTQNPACVAETTWEDGSKMQLIKDLVSGELYIWFQDYAWNIGDEVNKRYPVRLNFYAADGSVIGGDFDYGLINKNTIAIRYLDVETFIPAFMKMKELRLLMPGDIGNAVIPLEGSSGAIQKLAECIQESKKLPPASSTAPEAPKVPGQDI